MREIAEKVVGNRVALDILPAPMEGAMSNDEMTFEDEVAEDVTEDEPAEGELLDDDAVEEDVLADDVVVTADEDVEKVAGDVSDSEDGDTEALDDLEAEELEMLTEDEASETIVVDEATQLRDIRRAQISIEASAVGGAGENEFVCSVCFLVKKSSQLRNRRKKICRDCAV